MVSVSENFMNAYNSGAEQDIVLTFEDGSVIGKSDISITSGGLTISEYLNSDEDYTIGAASMAELKVTLINKDGKFDGFNFAQKFTLQFGVKVGDAFEYMPFGYWVGERPEKVKSRLIQFTAYDAMKMLDIPAEEFILGLTFPVTLLELYTQLMRYAGIPVFATFTPINSEMTFERNPFDSTDYSCREILAMISEASGGHARIRYSNTTRCMVLSVSRFSAVNYTINRTGRFELSVSDFPAPSISKLEVYTSYSDMLTTAGTGSNTYVIADNPLLYIENDTEVAGFQPYVDALYSELAAFPTYYPASVRAVGVPWLECGDIVKVIDDNGNALDFPIFAKTMTWNGSWTMELENSGGVTRQVLPIEQRELQNLKKKMLRTTDLYTEIDSYLSTEEGIASITSAVGGTFVTQDDISGFVTESQLDTSISQYINGAEGQAAITSAVSGQFLEKDALNGYAKTTEVSTAITQQIDAFEASLTLSASSSTSTSEIEADASVMGLNSNPRFTKTSDGYYTSTNGGTDNSFSYAVVYFNGVPSAKKIILRCISYGESNYDFGIISTLNTWLSEDYNEDTTNVLRSFKGQSSPNPVDVELDVPAGDSRITIKYRKDSSNSTYGDYFKFKVLEKSTSTTQTSTLTLKSGNTVLSSANITFEGIVTFESLATAGATVINGANITTGMISADRVDTTSLRAQELWYYDGTYYYSIMSCSLSANNTHTRVGAKDIDNGYAQYLELYGTQILLKRPGYVDGTDENAIMFDLANMQMVPTDSNEWYLGTESNYLARIYCRRYCFYDGSILRVDTDGVLKFRFAGESTDYIIDMTEE